MSLRVNKVQDSLLISSSDPDSKPTRPSTAPCGSFVLASLLDAAEISVALESRGWSRNLCWCDSPATAAVGTWGMDTSRPGHELNRTERTREMGSCAHVACDDHSHPLTQLGDTTPRHLSAAYSASPTTFLSLGSTSSFLQREPWEHLLFLADNRFFFLFFAKCFVTL